VTLIGVILSVHCFNITERFYIFEEDSHRQK